MIEYLIDLQDVSRHFGALTALRDVTLRLAPGRIGLLGPNGAGKSTLLKILMGLLPPSSGGGRILNHTLTSDSPANWQLRRYIRFIPQADALVSALNRV